MLTLRREDEMRYVPSPIIETFVGYYYHVAALAEIGEITTWGDRSDKAMATGLSVIFDKKSQFLFEHYVTRTLLCGISSHSCCS